MKILMEQWKKYLTEGEDKAIWKGYLGWKVPADKVSLDGVDQKYIDNRITRDGGDSFHITIITPPEVRGIIKDLKEKKPHLLSNQMELYWPTEKGPMDGLVLGSRRVRPDRSKYHSAVP